METKDKLLDLIENGDVEGILSEENLIEKFNELLKHELVELRDGKVFLTAKGKEAKITGVESVMRKMDSQREMIRFERTNHSKGENSILMSFLLLFTTLAIFLFLYYFGLFPA